MSDSSSLGSLSSGSEDELETKPQQKPQQDDNDDDDTSSSSSSDDDSSSSMLDSTDDEDAAAASRLELENNYILQMKWVPDRESLHSFRAGRRFESKYLPQIIEGLKNMPPPVVATKPAPKPAPKEPKQSEPKEKIKRDEAESSSSLLSSADSDDDDDDDVQSQKRLKTDEEAEDNYILEMGWVSNRESIASFRNARKFEGKYAQLIKDGLAKKASMPPQQKSSTTAVEKNDTNDVEMTTAQTTEPAPTEGKKAYVPYGIALESNSELLMVTRIPTDWFDIESDASNSIYCALESQLLSLDSESREAATLRSKIASLTKSEKPGLTDMVTQKLGQDILQGLCSIRPLLIGDSFIGTCILRYESASLSEAAWNYICHHHRVSSPADELKMVVANNLVVSLVCAPKIQQVKADGRIARYTVFPPPDIKIQRKRRPKPQAAESAPWLESHYTQGTTQKTPEQVKRAEEDEVVAAAKKDEQDAKLAKVTV